MNKSAIQPLTEADFHTLVQRAAGRPAQKYSFIGVGKTRKRVAVDKHHACSWIQSSVNLSTKQIKATVYINILPSPLPQKEKDKLKLLLANGISQFWSRKVIIGTVVFTVNTDVKVRPKSSIDVQLKIETSPKYARSHNSGILTPTFIYNEGFFKGNSSAADNDFQLVSAHEFGHSILEFYGGKTLSWGHKGSTNALLQSVKASTPGYPLYGEVDLMKYYDSNKQSIAFYDKVNRTIAAEQDVLRLIWMGKIHFTQ